MLALRLIKLDLISMVRRVLAIRIQSRSFVQHVVKRMLSGPSLRFIEQCEKGIVGEDVLGKDKIPDRDRFTTLMTLGIFLLLLVCFLCHKAIDDIHFILGMDETFETHDVVDLRNRNSLE